jgi:hypothetical protein
MSEELKMKNLKVGNRMNVSTICFQTLNAEAYDEVAGILEERGLEAEWNRRVAEKRAVAPVVVVAPEKKGTRKLDPLCGVFNKVKVDGMSRKQYVFLKKDTMSVSELKVWAIENGLKVNTIKGWLNDWAKGRNLPSVK